MFIDLTIANDIMCQLTNFGTAWSKTIHPECINVMKNFYKGNISFIKTIIFWNFQSYFKILINRNRLNFKKCRHFLFASSTSMSRTSTISPQASVFLLLKCHFCFRFHNGYARDVSQLNEKRPPCSNPYCTLLKCNKK